MLKKLRIYGQLTFDFLAINLKKNTSPSIIDHSKVLAAPIGFYSMSFIQTFLSLFSGTMSTWERPGANIIKLLRHVIYYLVSRASALDSVKNFHTCLIPASTTLTLYLDEQARVEIFGRVKCAW